MEAAGLGAPAPRRSVGRRLADLFHGRPRLQVGALLAGPVGWLVIGYLGSLLILLIASFWSLGELSGELEHTFTFDNFNTLLTDTVYRTITLRTILIAALVTRHRRAPGIAARVLHGEGREAALEGHAAGRGAGPALVLLPGQGLRLADDPERGRGPQLAARPARALRPRVRQRRRLAGDELHLAAVHDHPRLRRAGADPELGPRRLRRPRREALAHVPPGDLAARLPGHRSPARSSRSRSPSATSSPRSWSARRSSSATSSTPTSRPTCRSRPPSRRSRS